MKKNGSELRLWLLITGVSLGVVGIAIVLILIFGGGFEGVFADLGELQPILLIGALLVILASYFILFNYSKNTATKSRGPLKETVIGALCIALAFILSYIKLFNFPQGGSITPASMLPVMIYSYIYGANRGIIAGVALGLLNLIQEAYVIHWAQLLTDYVFAFAAIGLAGFFRKSLYPGIIVASFGRFFFAVLSGVIFFAEYAPPEMNPIIYSVVYNGTYMLPEMLICLGVALVPSVRNAVFGLRKQYGIAAQQTA